MRKIFLIASFLFLASNGFAVGGSCPSGANYINPSNPNGALVTLASLGVTNCFYVSAQSGASDSNSGVSESFPWLHAPGMPGCNSTCASVTPSAGMGFIFRGGDAWHFGNSASNPYTGGTWNWIKNGSSGSPIYIGVDLIWYSGASWARPILTSDNPVSTSTTLPGCSYQAGSSNILFAPVEISYLTFDDFEMTGMCQDSTITGANGNIYITDNASQYAIFERLYLHGGTHKQFACSLVSGLPVGMCYSATMFRGSNGSRVETGVQYLFDVLDNSDADIAGWAQIYDPAPTIAYTVFHGGSQIVNHTTHIFHDNLVENWVDPGDGIAHGNLWESLGSPAGVQAVYNNVFRNAYLTGIQGVCFWPNSMSSSNYYIFNNLWYNDLCGSNFINGTQNSGAQNQITFFNNTLENPQNGPMLTCVASPVYAAPWAVVNNHYITDASSPYMSGCLSPLVINYSATELRQPHSTATSQGYTASETYAYSPINGSGGTVDVGTNLISSYCAGLSTAASSDSTLLNAASSCGKDTNYACSYITSNHTVSCPARTASTRPGTGAWNIGTYEFSTSGSAPAITSATTSTCPIGLACSYQITATNSPTSYGATLPGCLSINTSTGLITGTCSSLATYSIPISATNVSGTGTATLSLNVGYLVQQAPGVVCSSVSTCTAPFSSNVQLHDLIVVPFAFPSGPSVTSVSDAHGDTFSQVGSSLVSSDGVQTQIFVAKSVAAGSGSVTVNLSAAPTFIVQQGPTEYTGLSISTPIDGQSGATGGPTVVSSGNFTTSNTNDEIYGYGRETTGGMSAGAGFTVLSNYNGHLIEQKLGATAGSYAATGTTSSDWSMQGIGFTAVSSAPAVSLSPTSLSFANQIVSTTSGSQSITLTNNGGTTLTISGITITGTNSGDFAQTNGCGSSVGAGSNCSISVTFTPLSTGARVANVSITDSAAGSPHTAPLSGTGISSSPAAPSGLAIIGIW